VPICRHSFQELVLDIFDGGGGHDYEAIVGPPTCTFNIISDSKFFTLIFLNPKDSALMFRKALWV